MAETGENRIAEERVKAGLTQGELSEKLGRSRSQLANMETGVRDVNLRELRAIAKILGCPVSSLLLDEDVPDLPDPDEAALLGELRSFGDYDTRAVLVATRGVLDAVRSVSTLQQLPKELRGDPALGRALAERWGDMDDDGRRKALQLLDTARSFSR